MTHEYAPDCRLPLGGYPALDRIGVYDGHREKRKRIISRQSTRLRGSFKVTGGRELLLCPPGPASTEGDIGDLHGVRGLIRGLMKSFEM
ncbi:hypothetical protein Trydic_g10300 [Trypoxylus dichotomus]